MRLMRAMWPPSVASMVSVTYVQIGVRAGLWKQEAEATSAAEATDVTAATQVTLS